MSTVYLSGVCRWAKLQKPDARYNYYGLELKPDETSLADLQALGITTLKPSKDGEGYYSFKRRPDQVIWSNREQRKAGPPEVYGSDGRSTKELIGNGSEVTICIEVFPYDNKFGKGISCRLDKVKVDKLVRYEDNLATEAISREARTPGFKPLF